MDAPPDPKHYTREHLIATAVVAFIVGVVAMWGLFMWTVSGLTIGQD